MGLKIAGDDDDGQDFGKMLKEDLVSLAEEQQTDLEDADNTISDVWDAFCDIDENSSKEDMLAAIDEACEIINEYDPDNFEIEGDNADDEAA